MQKKATIQYEFASLSQLILHLGLSIIQTVGGLSILALQIFANVTQTCGYQISVGFWSFPFFFISSLIIWISLWYRRSWICIIGMTIQLITTLVTTGNILVSIFILLNQISCSSSSLNIYYIPLHSTWIGIASAMKISHYIEIVLLYKFIGEIRLTDELWIADQTQNEIDHSRSMMIQQDMDDFDTLYM